MPDTEPSRLIGAEVEPEMEPWRLIGAEEDALDMEPCLGDQPPLGGMMGVTGVMGVNGCGNGVTARCGIDKGVVDFGFAPGVPGREDGAERVDAKGSVNLGGDDVMLGRVGLGDGDG